MGGGLTPTCHGEKRVNPQQCLTGICRNPKRDMHFPKWAGISTHSPNMTGKISPEGTWVRGVVKSPARWPEGKCSIFRVFLWRAFNRRLASLHPLYPKIQITAQVLLLAIHIFCVWMCVVGDSPLSVNFSWLISLWAGIFLTLKPLCT